MLLALGLSAVTFTILFLFWKLCNAAADLIEQAASELRRGGAKRASGEKDYT